MHPQVFKMMELFDGCKRAYGTYDTRGVKKVDDKLKGKAATIQGKPEPRVWEDHLRGVLGIGIIPINDDSMVKFGAVDVDKYNVNLKKLVSGIEKLGFPLIVCRSKSGGAHLYLFTSDFVAAKTMQDKLREMASTLGYGDCEIFPRQTQILAERGDIGQWINMPYFSEHNTDRYAVDGDGDPLNLDEFIELANKCMVSPEMLTSLKIDVTEDLADGPPCLQSLITYGFPPGTRNNGLLALGVYAKKKNPDNWEKLLNEANNTYMKPPLQSHEVQGVIKSLSKRDYTYQCDGLPLKSFCNASVCRARKHGIGFGSGLPAMGTLTKLDTDPPLWFLEVEDGGRLELTTDELQNPIKFQKKCMESLNMMPIILKRSDWQPIIQGLLENAHLVEMPKDSSVNSKIAEFIEAFCTGRVQARTHDDLLVGKPWLHKERHYFRLRDLEAYLDRMRFKDAPRNKICMVIKEKLKGKHKFMNIKGHGVNCWSIPEFASLPNKLKIPDEAKETPI